LGIISLNSLSLGIQSTQLQELHQLESTMESLWPIVSIFKQGIQKSAIVATIILRPNGYILKVLSNYYSLLSRERLNESLGSNKSKIIMPSIAKTHFNLLKWRIKKTW